MWTCPNCGRIFARTKQPHSCNKVPLGQHFKNKAKVKGLFDFLVNQINSKIGKCQIISIPCCIHLFGNYDFLAALPKRDRLEIRFAFGRKLDSSRLKQCVLMTAKLYKICIDIKETEDINEELIQWLNKAYYLKRVKQ